MANSTSSALEELLNITDSILSINNSNSATNSGPSSPISLQPPILRGEIDDSIASENVPTIFLLEECFSTIYGSREKEEKRGKRLEEEQKQHQNTFENVSDYSDSEEGGVQKKRHYNEGEDECTKANEDFKSYIDQLDNNHHDNGGTDVWDSRRRGKTLPLTKYEHNNSNVDHNKKEGRGLYPAEHVDKAQEKVEERDLLLEAVQARMKRQKERARKEHEALRQKSDKELTPTVGNRSKKQTYDFSGKKPSTGVDDIARNKIKNDGVGCVKLLSTGSKDGDDNEEPSPDDIASKCLQDFLHDVKEFQKQHGSSSVDESTREAFTDLLTERYLCGRLGQHLPLTPTVFKVRKVISSFVEKCSCGADDPLHHEKQLFLKIEEKTQAKEQPIAPLPPPSTMIMQSSTKNRNAWNCNVCGRENDSPANNACITCGRIKGYKTKNRMVLSPPEENPKAINLGDVTVRMSAGEEEAVQFDFQRDNEEKQKLQKTRRRKEDFHLKQKLDYEADSRKGLADDINDVLSSIRSSIDM